MHSEQAEIGGKKVPHPTAVVKSGIVAGETNGSDCFAPLRPPRWLGSLATFIGRILIISTYEVSSRRLPVRTSRGWWRYKTLQSWSKTGMHKLHKPAAYIDCKTDAYIDVADVN
jgi:hypothetical protein